MDVIEQTDLLSFPTRLTPDWPIGFSEITVERDTVQNGDMSSKWGAGVGWPTHPGSSGAWPVLALEVPDEWGWPVILLVGGGQRPCGMFPFVIWVEWWVLTRP